MPWRRSTSGLPLPLLAGGGAFFGCAAAVGVAMAVSGAPSRPAAFLAGFAVAAVAGALAAFAATRYTRGLRVLRAQAIRRLHDPSGSTSTGSLSVRSSSEVNELARTLEALHLRVRVADEVAERHRRSAQTASIGMFELLSGLVAAEEGARGQLAAELHDTVAQTLSLARSHLSGAETPQEIAAAGDFVAEAEDQVRAVMARTRPPALRDDDLAQAVGALRDDLLTRYGLTVRIAWPAEAHPLPLVTAVTVYRFFQEALLNVVKHADVDEAQAALFVDREGVTAAVSDAGPGFDPDQVRPVRGRHVGLGLLRERARLAGGSLDVTSWPHDGTTLTLRLPLGPAGHGTDLPQATPGRELADGGHVGWAGSPPHQASSVEARPQSTAAPQRL